MKKYKIQKAPFVVPTTDGKLIEEHFGNASIKSELSVAHMIAPPNWREPFQIPDFDEYTYIIKGKKQFNIEGEKVVLEAGQSIKINKGSNKLTLKVDNPGLVLGNYSMIFYVYDRMRNVIFWVENCSTFQISNLNNVSIVNGPVKSHIIPNIKVDYK